MSLIVSLRSDIFAYLQRLAAEQDKLPIHRIVWDDESLLRVLDQRLVYRLPSKFDASDLWRQLFPNEVVGLPVRGFITSNTLTRPRDVIFLVKQAIAEAVNCGRNEVVADDFLSARAKYSEFAFRSLLAEDDPTKNRLEAVLYEFAGAPKVISEGEIRSRITRAGVDQVDIDFYLKLLCDVNFLAIQTVTGYRYPSGEGERETLLETSKRIARDRGWGDPSYQLNAAFHQVLQIE